MSKSKKLSPIEVESLENAVKVFNYWFKVLLEKPEMNDVDNRKEYLIALQDLENITQKKEVD